MKQTLSLDDCRLFFAVADNGGLAGAMRATGVSVPTLSRRMTALEGTLGRRLFARGPRGYALTAQGRDFLDEVSGLRAASARIAAFAGGDNRARVRITAGHWTAQFLARQIGRYWSPDDGWVPELLASTAAVGIARREADIGIRNRRPEQGWLAGRCTGRIEYAAFAVAPETTGYITLPESAGNIPSVAWVRRNHGDDVVTTVSDPRLAVDLAIAGVGRAVLPVFAGRMYDSLAQIGPCIDDLTHDEWLVSHHEARNDPPVRKALDAITALLADRSARRGRPDLYSG